MSLETGNNILHPYKLKGIMSIRSDSEMINSSFWLEMRPQGLGSRGSGQGFLL